MTDSIHDQYEATGLTPLVMWEVFGWEREQKMTGMTADQILAGALNSVETNGWCQGELQSADGRLCAMGHLYRTADWVNKSDSGEFNTELLKATGLLSDAIGQFMGAKFGYPGATETRWPVPVWNDADYTTEEDVKLVFKRAVELAGE